MLRRLADRTWGRVHGWIRLSRLLISWWASGRCITRALVDVLSPRSRHGFGFLHPNPAGFGVLTTRRCRITSIYNTSRLNCVGGGVVGVTINPLPGELVTPAVEAPCSLAGPSGSKDFALVTAVSASPASSHLRCVRRGSRNLRVRSVVASDLAAPPVEGGRGVGSRVFGRRPEVGKGTI